VTLMVVNVDASLNAGNKIKNILLSFIKEF
jgi:hypothetical protein